MSGSCEDVQLRIEKDVVTSNENCYQKDAELCGPRNCKVIEKLAIRYYSSVLKVNHHHHKVNS